MLGPGCLLAALLAAAIAAAACNGGSDAEGKTATPTPTPVITSTPPATNPTPQTGTQGTGTTGTPQVTAAPPTYPDTTKGLESLVSALVEATQQDDPNQKARLLDSIRLPDPTWFRESFDQKVADRLIEEYKPMYDGIGHLLTVLQPLIAQGPIVAEAEEFTKAEAPGATGYQSAALSAAKKPIKLYSVRLSTPDRKRTFHLWSFVHLNGTFRFVGKMRRAVDKPPTEVNGRDPLEYRQSDRDRMPPADKR